MDCQYSGKDKVERQKFGQFFTPPPLTIKMLEKFESIKNKSILDPSLGAGGLIAAAIIAGANPKMCYGIEIDPDILEVAKKRLCPMGVPEKNLKLGDALDPSSYEFENTTLKLLLKKDSSGNVTLYTDISDNSIKPVEVKLYVDNKLKTKNIKIVRKLISTLQKNIGCNLDIADKHREILNALFKKVKLEII